MLRTAAGICGTGSFRDIGCFTPQGGADTVSRAPSERSTMSRADRPHAAPPHGPPPGEQPDEPPSRVYVWRERMKQRSWVVVGGLVVLILGITAQFSGYAAVVYQYFSDQARPYESEYAALANLDLEMTSAAVEKLLGVPVRNYDLCEALAGPDPALGGSTVEDGKLLVYEVKGGAVRAVFDDDQLMLYLVTPRALDFRPPIVWLGDSTQGRLGEKTFAEVLQGVTAGADVPSDVFAGATPRFAAYAETFAYGAPGNYQGFMMAYTPEGDTDQKAQKDSFNFDAALELAMAEGRGDADDPALVKAFRSKSTPNTYGSFKDDGAVGTLARDAANVYSILLVGRTF